MSHYHGCKNLADIFVKKKLDRFIQIGSSIENGSIKSPQIENQNIKPKRCFFGITKGLLSRLLP